MRYSFIRIASPTTLLLGTLIALAPACEPDSETTSTTSSSSGTATGSGTTTGSSSESGACEKQAADLQGLLDKNKPSAAPGAILAVLTPSCGTWIGVSGNSTASEPMRVDDAFRIGSVTKTFVSARVLQLVEAGTVELEDTLEHWLPGFPGGESIHVNQLLNHTSGIFNITEDQGWLSAVGANPMRKWGHQELVDIAAAHPPYFAPGGGFHYSNTNYILLGMLIEKATGDTLGKQLRAHLLEPNQLGHTSLDGEEPIVGHLAHGFSGEADVSTLVDPSIAWSAGALVSSPADLVKWGEALYSGKVLEPDTMKRMLTAVESDIPGFRYGLGVFVGEDAVGHAGDFPGYHTDLLYVPSKKVSFAVMVNADGADPMEVSTAVLAYFHQ